MELANDGNHHMKNCNVVFFKNKKLTVKNIFREIPKSSKNLKKHFRQKIDSV
jgi:hypothetical protein